MAKCVCVNCQKIIQFRDDLLGKRAKCPGCKATLSLLPTDPPPAPPPTSGKIVSAGMATGSPTLDLDPPGRDASAQHRVVSRSSPPTSVAARNSKKAVQRTGSPQDEVRLAVSHFTAKISPVRTSLPYLLGLLIVCVVMMLMPIIYLGLIGVVAYGVYYHLIHHAVMLQFGSGRARLLVFAAYVAPLVIGIILVFFMTKPLLAAPVNSRRYRSLTREAEPLLFDLVDRICTAVGSATPRRIDVDANVNASAGFRNGIWSLLLGKDLVLTIGMPLVTGMSVTQLAGILAHEFGHFSQGLGMRVSYIIRAISHWFLRVVYQRDAWDEMLANSVKEVDIRIGWILMLSQVFVWLTRQILYLLMLVGHGVAGYFSRQMEFDADRYETRLVGSNTFASTVLRLNELGLAYQMAQHDLGQSHREGRLPDNMPLLVEANRLQITAEQRKAIEESITSGRTGWFDSHPADHERIASAAKEGGDGLLRIDAPAELLFQHFGAVCCGVTKDYYEAALGKAVSPQQLRPVGELLADQQLASAEFDQLKELAGGQFDPWWGIEFGTSFLETPTKPQGVLADLKLAQASLTNSRDKVRATREEYVTNRKEYLMSLAALVVQRAQLPIKRIIPASKSVTREDARKACQRYANRLETLQADLSPQRLALGGRMVAALRLLRVPAVANEIADAEDRSRHAQELLDAIQRMNGVLPSVRELQDHFMGLSLLCDNLDGAPEGLFTELDSLARKITVCVKSISETLSRVPNPLGKSDGDTIGAHLMPAPYRSDDLRSVYATCSSILEGFPSLYLRLASKLAVTVNDVEQVIQKLQAKRGSRASPG